MEGANLRMIDSVGVLPWLDIRANIQVGAITFYRADSIDAVLGDRAGVLADRLRIYRDAWENNPVHGTVAIHADQVANGGNIHYGDLRRSTDMLMIASIFENDGELCDCNAATFTLYVQRLGGEPGFMATRTRRRNGGYLSGGTTDIVVSRPTAAATFWTYNRQILEARRADCRIRRPSFMWQRGADPNRHVLLVYLDRTPATDVVNAALTFYKDTVVPAAQAAGTNTLACAPERRRRVPRTCRRQ